MMKSFVDEAQAYANYHENTFTRFAYRVGSPLILFALMILLGFVHVVIVGVLDISLALVASLLLLIYYFRLHWRLGLALTPALFIMLWLANFFSSEGPSAFSAGVLVVFLLIGLFAVVLSHFLEKNHPRWGDSLWQIIIAPLFMTAELFFLTGHLRELDALIHGKPLEEKETKDDK
jgi:uncharacterized membrane protein YGL010W